MKPVFFKTPAEFRKWLEKNHDKVIELLVGFYKVSSGKQSITWSESVDQAICFGWIDGIRKSIDDMSYTIRFTPRKAKSIWSRINIAKVNELTKKGLMFPAGIAAFQKREEKHSGIYSFEQKEKNIKLNNAFEKLFKNNKEVWKFFNDQPPYYKRAATWWVISAKQETTKLKRLQTLINDSEQGLHIKLLRRTTKK